MYVFRKVTALLIQLFAVGKISDETLPILPIHTFVAGTIPSDDEHLHTAIGFAWMSWNSRLGLPHDVWILISTACQTCETCDYVRTLSADVGHRDHNGRCMKNVTQ